jgi:outer membrane biosynthesis protein TonB
MNLKLHNISNLGVFALSIVLLTGISLVPTLQIGVQGQVQQQQSPLAPPPPGTIAPPSTIPEPPPETIAPEQTISPPPPPPPAPTEPTSPPPAPETTTTRPPPSFGAAGEGAANQTSEGGSIVNQSAMVMIPQSTMEMIMSNVQDAMTSVDNDNMEEAMMALETLDQELKSAANAAGMSVETTTEEGDTSGDGDDDGGGDTAE